jgi:hypothetical protein
MSETPFLLRGNNIKFFDLVFCSCQEHTVFGNTDKTQSLVFMLYITAEFKREGAGRQDAMLPDFPLELYCPKGSAYALAARFCDLATWCTGAHILSLSLE